MWENFIGVLILCGYVFFLFGWYVYEKVIFLVIIFFSLIVLCDWCYFGVFCFLVVVGYVFLFFLLFMLGEFLIKMIYIIFWLVVFLMVFDKLVLVFNKLWFFFLDCFSIIYIVISIFLIVYMLVIY